MTTQTKCTIALCCLFIVEIFPLPFTAFISLYVIRKRPGWFPKVVKNLYIDKVFDEPGADPLQNADAMKTRSKCTFTLSCMTVIDLIIPVTIPTAIFIIRKRPRWFKNIAARLYADISSGEQTTEDVTVPIDGPLGELDTQADIAAAQLKKQLEIERSNRDFAHLTAEPKSYIPKSYKTM